MLYFIGYFSGVAAVGLLYAYSLCLYMSFVVRRRIALIYTIFPAAVFASAIAINNYNAQNVCIILSLIAFMVIWRFHAQKSFIKSFIHGFIGSAFAFLSIPISIGVIFIVLHSMKNAPTWVLGLMVLIHLTVMVLVFVVFRGVVAKRVANNLLENATVTIEDRQVQKIDISEPIIEFLPEKIHLLCPHCQTSGQAGSKFIGQSMTCPKCGKSFVLDGE